LQEYRVNEKITAREVRLIDENGNQIGIVPIEEALEAANRKGLDLVEIAPQANPPVCKILNYSKFKYEIQKKEKEAKKKQKESAINIKDINLKVMIDNHDLAIKIKQMREFLEDGDKVRVRIRFRGRENIYPELGNKLVDKIISELADVGVLEKPPLKENAFLTFTLLPKKK
jgi:translation initiation factor IF-3